MQTPPISNLENVTPLFPILTQNHDYQEQDERKIQSGLLRFHLPSMILMIQHYLDVNAT